MTIDPQQATIADLFRLMTEANGKLDNMDDRLSRIEQELPSHRVRMQAVEQHAAAMVEQGATINRRLDQIVERMERVERKLDRAPV